MLAGAGVIQGLDGRDSSVSTSGLYQALTYQSGLSGGGWLLSSLAGNNYPTISYLRDKLWSSALAETLLFPGGIFSVANYVQILADVLSKEAAGYDTTLVDFYGRLLSFQLLSGADGGAAKTLSAIASSSNFTSHNVPYPIITALGSKVWDGECAPGPNGTTYEFSPYEFGSWDKDVSAFTPTQYLGTSLRGGKPSTTTCTTNYDNLGYILGTSSDIFAVLCANAPQIGGDELANRIEDLLDDIHEVNTEDSYAHYKNPFYEYKSSSQTFNIANNISAQEELSLVDGGIALQNMPLLPLLQPQRNISVIFANDNSADTDNWPNGTALLTTYIQSFNLGLDNRMPFIPPVEEFISKGLNKRATFFGCEEKDKTTIVYLPNMQYTFASNVATADIQYNPDETRSMIANGQQIASQGGDADWGTCLGCAVMGKSGGTLPGECEACFAEYCYVAGV